MPRITELLNREAQFAARSYGRTQSNHFGPKLSRAVKNPVEVSQPKTLNKNGFDAIHHKFPSANVKVFLNQARIIGGGAINTRFKPADLVSHEHNKNTQYSPSIYQNINHLPTIDEGLGFESNVPEKNINETEVAFEGFANEVNNYGLVENEIPYFDDPAKITSFPSKVVKDSFIKITGDKLKEFDIAIQGIKGDLKENPTPDSKKVLVEELITVSAQREGVKRFLDLVNDAGIDETPVDEANKSLSKNELIEAAFHDFASQAVAGIKDPATGEPYVKDLDNIIFSNNETKEIFIYITQNNVNDHDKHIEAANRELSSLLKQGGEAKEVERVKAEIDVVDTKRKGIEKFLQLVHKTKVDSPQARPRKQLEP